MAPVFHTLICIADLMTMSVKALMGEVRSSCPPAPSFMSTLRPMNQ